MQEKVAFASFDGTPLNGVFTRPNSGTVSGAVLLLHGTPSEKNEDGFHSESPNPSATYKKLGGLVEYLDSCNVATFRFDYREQGENARTPNMENLSVSGMIADTEAGYQVLRHRLATDVPICVVGTSFAGGLSVKWLAAHDRVIKHLFLMAPLLDFPYTIRKTGVTEMDVMGMERLKKEAVSALESQGYLLSGGKRMSREFINEVMMMNVERDFMQLPCDCTIFHGTLDPVVPIEASFKFASLLGARARVIAVEGAVHGFGEQGDLEWATEKSKSNHEFVYLQLLERIRQ
jgi:alpha-beta hydrolase superfamily lysophospholipase